MIEQLTDFPDNVAAFRCTGQVTKVDYLRVLVPAVLGKLRTHDKVRVYYETAKNFSGFEAGAMWEDFKVGVEYLTRWDKVAVVSDVDWIGKAVRFFAFLMPATTTLFSQAEAAQARAWISA
jgi:SpoIIAA-like